MKPGALLTTWVEGIGQHHQQDRRQYISRVTKQKEEQMAALNEQVKGQSRSTPTVPE